MEALLVIDIQPETVRPRSAESLINDWNAIIGTYNPNVVAYVANLGPFSKIPQGSPFAEGLNIVSENIFYKRMPDAFTNSALSAWLEEIGAKSVRLIGIDGNWCIKSTALGAVKHGFESHVVRNAVASRNEKVFMSKTIEKLRCRGIKID